MCIRDRYMGQLKKRLDDKAVKAQGVAGTEKHSPKVGIKEEAASLGRVRKGCNELKEHAKHKERKTNMSMENGRMWKRYKHKADANFTLGKIPKHRKYNHSIALDDTT
eukprot:TRINITY_DN11705_c0_g1_i5.p1 TRINITY_DN11705_c0_g1~~TRINITY_DN11705_c0_g1_i5.p1  ORF type:complete len:108 (+),score=42.04 TRINITY_DN11705_c0_g1_i5:82-405(+)